jgi:16S rRNA (uracil1498-N3)-methyltransferase
MEAVSIMDVLTRATRHPNGTAKWWFFIGPEGGWTPEELALFAESNVQPLKLTDTILRVETAAITTAAIASVLVASNPKSAI